MAICPTGAITISGRAISPEDLFEIGDTSSECSYEQLLPLLQKRRSIREFKEVDVADDVVEKIMAAARTAPMGLPPSDVNVLIIQGRVKADQFAKDYCDSLEKMKWFVSSWFLFLLRPFMSRANSEMFRDFIKPLFGIYIEGMKKGENLVTYNAPLAVYFYGSPYTDPADPLIAATYAMVAGESLGLGPCMLGGIHPLIQNGSAARKLRDKWGIRYKSREGIFVIFGYPAVKYRKQISRTFASETYVRG